ncbi:hypothetical protein AwDysgo_05530 [Bacteroidales bacterium]|nr:hypothetical protein AwDysgo_05530 [Bacteroidales bacterium]
MKKKDLKLFIYVFIAVHAVLWQPSKAQVSTFQQGKFIPELSVGGNIGINYAKIDFQKAIQQNNLQQYIGGISVRYISERHFGLQAELNLSQRGWDEADKDSIGHQYARSIRYLEIPLLTHIYFNAGKRARIVFNLGPHLSFLLNEKDLKNNIVIKDLSEGKEIPPYYETGVQRVFDYGIMAGMGLEIRTGVGSFIAEGRYTYGLSDIFSNNKSDYFSKSSNQATCIKLTYLFQLN